MRGLACCWLPEDDWQTVNRRLSLTLTGTVWSCLAAPFLSGLLWCVSLRGLSAVMDTRSSEQFWRWLETTSQFERWPVILQWVAVGVPYFVICLAFDWWSGRCIFRPSTGAERARLTLWLWTANSLSYAALIGLLLALFHALGNVEFSLAK